MAGDGVDEMVAALTGGGSAPATAHLAYDVALPATFGGGDPSAPPSAPSISTGQLVELLKQVMQEDIGIPRGPTPAGRDAAPASIAEAYEMEAPGMVAVVDECPVHFRKENFQAFNSAVRKGVAHALPGPIMVVEDKDGGGSGGVFNSNRSVCVPEDMPALPADVQESLKATIMDSFVEMLVSNAANQGSLVLQSMEKCQKIKSAEACEPQSATDAAAGGACMYFGSGCFNRELIQNVMQKAGRSRGMTEEAIKETWKKVQNSVRQAVGADAVA